MVNLPVKAELIPEETREARVVSQNKISERYNNHSRPLTPLQPCTQVTYQDAGLWKPGIIARANVQPRNYTIQTRSNTTVVRNRRHIRPATSTAENTEPDIQVRGTDQSRSEQQETVKRVHFKDPIEDGNNRDMYITRSGRTVKLPKPFY